MRWSLPSEWLWMAMKAMASKMHVQNLSYCLHHAITKPHWNPSTNLWMIFLKEPIKSYLFENLVNIYENLKDSSLFGANFTHSYTNDVAFGKIWFFIALIRFKLFHQFYCCPHSSIVSLLQVVLQEPQFTRTIWKLVGMFWEPTIIRAISLLVVIEFISHPLNFYRIQVH